MRIRRPWPTQRRNAEAALRAIRDSVYAAAIDVGDGMYAWGQFLDYPQENSQRGVYGTSAAVLTLYLCGEGDMPRSREGSKWLEAQYTDPNSKANLKRDFVRLYRLAITALAFHHAGSASAGPAFAKLMSRRHDAYGWGEYHDDGTLRDNEARVMPTAFAFFALSVHPSFRGSTNQPPEVLAWLVGQLKDEPSDSAPVERALTALAAVQSGIDIDKDAQDILLEPLRRRIDRRKEVGEWYPHHYSVREPDGGGGDDVWSGNYIYFPTDAIVTEALMATDRLDQAYAGVWDVAHYYASSTVTDGAFKQREHRRKAVLDQYWLARLFALISQKSPQSALPARVVADIRRRTWLRIPVLLLIALLLLGVWIPLSGLVSDLIDEPDTKLRILGWLAGGAALGDLLLLGWILKGMFGKGQ